MPSGEVLLILLAAAGLVVGGRYVAVGTKKASVATYHHVLRPVGRGVEKVVTLGHHPKKENK